MDAFRYDTSFCRAGSTEPIHPWHGDHRATQEQNHAISHTPASLFLVCHLAFRRAGAEVRKHQALALEGGGGGAGRGVT